jgi:hypothetical protein
MMTMITIIRLHRRRVALIPHMIIIIIMNHHLPVQTLVALIHRMMIIIIIMNHHLPVQTLVALIHRMIIIIIMNHHLPVQTLTALIPHMIINYAITPRDTTRILVRLCTNLEDLSIPSGS